MTIGDDGAPSERRETTTSNDKAQSPARRSGAIPVVFGIIAFILIAGGFYLYEDRNSEKEVASTQPKVATEGSQPAPAGPSPSPSEQVTPGSSPSSPPAAPPAPTQQSPSPPSSPPPDRAAQAPSPAEQPAAQSQPMRQQPTNLPESSETMSVRVGHANIRSAPRVGASVLVTTSKGARLKVLRHAGKWVQVEVDGRNGWINAKLLKSD